MYWKSWNNLLIWGLSFNVLLNFKRLDSNYLKRTESQCLRVHACPFFPQSFSLVDREALCQGVSVHLYIHQE